MAMSALKLSRRGPSAGPSDNLVWSGNLDCYSRLSLGPQAGVSQVQPRHGRRQSYERYPGRDGQYRRRRFAVD